MSDQNIVNHVQKLIEAKKNIELFLFENRSKLAAIKNSRELSLKSIIDYADLITLTIHAPKYWTPNAPLIGGHPPAPQFEQMRAGALQKLSQDYSRIQRRTDDSEDENIYEYEFLTSSKNGKKSGSTISHNNKRKLDKIEFPDKIISDYDSKEISPNNPEIEPTQSTAKFERLKNISFSFSDSEDSN